MLGIQFIKGKIVMGNQKGKDLGLPTANIILTKEEFNSSKVTLGVFITKVKIDNEYNIFTAVSSISELKDGSYLIETHVINYAKYSTDFYNRQMTISFLKKIREPKTFTSLNELTSQIDKDTKMASDYTLGKRTCVNCIICYRQDEGYSNYTVTDSVIGCFLNHFGEFDANSTNLEWESNKHLYAESCKAYEEGEMWYLDVDGEEPRPSDEQIAIWHRNHKINQVIE